MWRFIEGVKPPKRPVPTTNVERAEYLKEYESKRSRKFQESWKVEFPWLEYSEENGRMTCKSCRTVRGKNHELNDNQFIKGCTNFKKETLKLHQNNDFHKKSCSMRLAKEKTPGSSDAEKIIQTLNKVNIDKLMIMFRNVHALVKHARPFTDYVWMCKLDEKKGLNIGNTYRTDKQAREFTHHISAIVREQIKKEIAQASFLSILCDGATDSAIIEEEIIYIRYSIKGNVITHFIGIKQVEKADAQGIFRAIMAIIEELDLLPGFKNKLIALGTDGARVMLGHKNGVISLLQQLNDKVIAVHCFAHRLELTYKESLKNINLYDKVITLVMNLYYFYHNSPLNRANLRNACATLNIPYLVPTRIGGTRWIGHVLKAIQQILKIYPGIVIHLEQMIETPGASSEAKSKARGFLKQLQMKDIITFVAFLVDVLVPLNILSQQFQKRHAVISDIYVCIKNTLTVIENYKVKSSPEVRKLDTQTYYKELTTALSLFPDAKDKAIERIMKCISERFSDVMEEGLIAATSIANLKELISSLTMNENSKNATYGIQQIHQIMNHYGSVLQQAGIKMDEIEREWEMLVVCLKNMYKDNSENLDWKVINFQYGEDYPNILLLIDLILSIPASTAECERGFSCMRKVKTDWRNSLGDKTLSDLLLVQLESSPIETFNPLPAIHHWNSSSSRARRPTFYDQAHSSNQIISNELNSSDLDITSDSDCDLYD